MKSTLKLAINAILFSGAALTVNTASASDKALLDTLLSNGSINSAQHAKLANNSSTGTSAMSGDFLKKFDWVTKIKFKGDMRYRYEASWNGKTKSRHRIRARFGIQAKPTDDLKVNMRFATGGGATSTNASLDDGFSQKSFWLDRAYFDYSPAWAQGVHFIGGKMKQQWYQVSNNVWDSDTNPDGLALKYAYKVGNAKMTVVGGYYLIGKVVDGESHTSWSSNSEALQMGHYGFDAAFKFGKNIEWSIGHNGYIYDNNDKYIYADPKKPEKRTGNNSDNINFAIYEFATKLKIKTGIMPITLMAQYSGNAAVQKDGNAWTLGASTKYKGFKFGYDYRSTEKDAVIDLFNDSDFNHGKTDAQGHRLKFGYGFNKYFYVGATYFNAVSISNPDSKPKEMMQIDIKAKF